MGFKPITSKNKIFSNLQKRKPLKNSASDWIQINDPQNEIFSSFWNLKRERLYKSGFDDIKQGIDPCPY